MRKLIIKLLIWLKLKNPSGPSPSLQGGGGPGEEGS